MRAWYPDRIERLRALAGCSQRALSARARVSQTWLSRVESGQQEPSFSNVLAVMDALGADMELLACDRRAFERHLLTSWYATWAIGHDADGPVALRRDGALAGGPHSLLYGAGAQSAVTGEIELRERAGLATLVLDVTTWDAPTLVVDPRHAPVLAEHLHDGLHLIARADMLSWPDLGQQLRAVLCEGRKYGISLGLHAPIAPRLRGVERANISQVGRVGVQDGVLRHADASVRAFSVAR